MLPSGRTHYRTCAGSCVSLLVVLATLFFIALEVHHILHQNTFVVQSGTKRNAIQPQDAFPSRLTDGSLQMAFGVVDLSDRREIQEGDSAAALVTSTPPIPESVGTLEAWYRTRKDETSTPVSGIVG